VLTRQKKQASVGAYNDEHPAVPPKKCPIC
jgi:hypothetical protein